MKKTAFLCLLLCLALSLAACGGTPVVTTGAQTTAPSHTHTYDAHLTFRPYKEADEDGVIGLVYSACNVCREIRGASARVLVNADFEVEEMSGADYFDLIPGLSARPDCDGGSIKEGVWYNTSKGQLFANIDRDLSTLDCFVLSVDIMLGAYAAKNTFIGWGKYGEGLAGSYYFQLHADENGKVHYWKNFTEYEKGTEAFASLTLDREHWWHIELAVRPEAGTVTLYAGMYEDQSLDTLVDFREIGTADSILYPSGARNHYILRFSHYGGLYAMDNLRITLGSSLTPYLQ